METVAKKKSTKKVDSSTTAIVESNKIDELLETKVNLLKVLDENGKIKRYTKVIEGRRMDLTRYREEFPAYVNPDFSEILGFEVYTIGWQTSKKKVFDRNNPKGVLIDRVKKTKTDLATGKTTPYYEKGEFFADFHIDVIIEGMSEEQQRNILIVLNRQKMIRWTNRENPDLPFQHEHIWHFRNRERKDSTAVEPQAPENSNKADDFDF